MICQYNNNEYPKVMAWCLSPSDIFRMFDERRAIVWFCVFCNIFPIDSGFETKRSVWMCIKKNFEMSLNIMHFNGGFSLKVFGTPVVFLLPIRQIQSFMRPFNSQDWGRAQLQSEIKPDFITMHSYKFIANKKS